MKFDRFPQIEQTFVCVQKNAVLVHNNDILLTVVLSAHWNSTCTVVKFTFINNNAHESQVVWDMSNLRSYKER